MKPMNERYKILFESVEIGPKVAKNRFYQVPHAMGSGNDMPCLLYTSDAADE